MFKKLGNAFLRFRILRLNRWADSLLEEAEYHKEQAKVHSVASTLFWIKSSDLRSMARRISAAKLL